MSAESELQSEKSQYFDKVAKIIEQEGYIVADKDTDRPWGGFYRLADGDAEQFISKYFPDMEFESFEGLSPKFLIVEAGKRLSWQHHDRRAELWRVLEGPVGVKISDSDEEPEEVRTLKTGELIQFSENVRHRLIGLSSNWGIVTEIWQHVDPTNPSDESDIYRIQDDFKR